MNKKGVINIWDNWAELLAFCLLIIGFIFSASAGSAVISYIVIFLCGMAAGRLWYRQKNNLKFPWFLALMGFLLGYVIGSFYGSKRVIILLFIIGAILSYYLHAKEIIKTTDW
ncbi:hypothetical protein GF351_05385 [Candidatus Woesearchaeota archaeon]|nr:hypothetical protein [Candidatus Woesearchaeota archaeon]